MPFKSAKQREYLKRNHPELYAKWLKKYGSKPQPTADLIAEALRMVESPAGPRPRASLSSTKPLRATRLPGRPVAVRSTPTMSSSTRIQRRAGLSYRRPPRRSGPSRPAVTRRVGVSRPRLSSGFKAHSAAHIRHVRVVQTSLRRAGFNPGKVDGVKGPRTLRAVNRFKRAHGLPADGRIGHRVLRLLRQSRRAGL